ncbi:MAG: DUF3450 family protein [Planctomycetota bacterium]
MTPGLNVRWWAVGSRRSAIGVSLLSAAVWFLPLAGFSPGERAGGKLDDTRSVLEQWVETRKVISKERRDWVLGRELLNDRIELVGREIESLRGKIKEAETSIAEADKKRSELVTETDKLKEAAVALTGRVGTLEGRTKDLLERLPDPIRERVKPLSQQLPVDPEQSKLSLSERFRNVVGILNEVNKFNREITLTSEVRALRNGSAAEVTAMYVGIGQGYYVTSDQTAAGVGTPSAGGFVWAPADGAAADIARAIAILKNEQVAEFVQLPVRIE